MGGLNLYGFVFNQPLGLIDTLGKNVYIAYRTLLIPILEYTAPITGHVYLAFNDENMGDSGIWNKTLNDLGYDHRDWYTFSFHPDSVRTESREFAKVSVVYTNSSWVNRNNENADIRPIVNKDAGLILVTKDPCQQAAILKEAHASFLANPGGKQANDRGYYSFAVNNCGSWAKSIIESAGSDWPPAAYFLNLGAGLNGPLDFTLVPQATYALVVTGYHTGEAIGFVAKQTAYTLQGTYKGAESTVTWIIRNSEFSTDTFRGHNMESTKTVGAIKFSF